MSLFNSDNEDEDDLFFKPTKSATKPASTSSTTAMTTANQTYYPPSSTTIALPTVSQTYYRPTSLSESPSVTSHFRYIPIIILQSGFTYDFYTEREVGLYFICWGVESCHSHTMCYVHRNSWCSWLLVGTSGTNRRLLARNNGIMRPLCNVKKTKEFRWKTSAMMSESLLTNIIFNFYYVSL